MPSATSASCNIGGPEVERRKKAAILSAGISALSIIAVLVLDASREFRVVVFIPVFVTVIGWFQVKRKFCLAYGLAGVFNFGELGSVSSVKDPLQIKRDRLQVIATVFQALLISALPSALIIIV